MSDNSEKLQGIRHSLAHLLAQTVRALYPGAQNAIGPAIEDGFYQDFDMPQPISDADLPKIEAEMRKRLPNWTKWEKRVVSLDEVKKEFSWNKYKVALAEEFAKEGKDLTFYTSGGLVDLCKGGHDTPLAEIDPQSFKLTRVAGVYWRGDEKNKMLTRIYGLAFNTKKELAAHMAMLEEAKKRDHKKLGRELDLFVFSDLVGPGLPLWTPKGTMLRILLDDYVWQLRKEKGYERVEIPHITKKELYEISGHWDKFKNDLFRIQTREGHEFAMKPMNCPHHTQIYTRKLWSYRELPQRYANTTMCYRDEQTGELSGLSRVRSFTQDDAHVFCRYSQIEEELEKIWDVVDKFYEAVGLKLRLRLSLHDPDQPEKYLGDKNVWKKAEAVMKALAKQKKIDYFEAPGEAAFYGPKLDFMAADSLGREWQVATIQLDMNMPERFDLTCVNEDGKSERIAMLHAAIMGSIERFLSVVIEHLAGAFPVWLSPVQVAVLPISDKHVEYAKSVQQQLRDQNIRVELDERTESIGKKIREASMQKIPYMLIVGDKEIESKKVAVRARRKSSEALGEGGGDEDLGQMPLAEFLERIQSEIKTKSLKF